MTDRVAQTFLSTPDVSVITPAVDYIFLLADVLFVFLLDNFVAHTHRGWQVKEGDD